MQLGISYRAGRGSMRKQTWSREKTTKSRTRALLQKSDIQGNGSKPKKNNTSKAGRRFLDFGIAVFIATN